jgi:hypothetical protein
MALTLALSAFASPTPAERVAILAAAAVLVAMLVYARRRSRRAAARLAAAPGPAGHHHQRRRTGALDGLDSLAELCDPRPDAPHHGDVRPSPVSLSDAIDLGRFGQRRALRPNEATMLLGADDQVQAEVVRRYRETGAAHVASEIAPGNLGDPPRPPRPRLRRSRPWLTPSGRPAQSWCRSSWWSPPGAPSTTSSRARSSRARRAGRSSSTSPTCRGADATGLGVLVRAHRRAQLLGVTLVLTGLSDDLRTLFELTRLDSLFAMRA